MAKGKKQALIHCPNHPDRIGVIQQRGQPLCWECADVFPEIKADRIKQYYGGYVKPWKIGIIKR